MSIDQKSSNRGDPTWDIVDLFPPQGYWAEYDYLGLDTNRLVELSDGNLEVLPMPTELHQMIVAFLYDSLKQFLTRSSFGTVIFAPLRVRLWEGQFREPDVVFMLSENSSRRTNRYWNGADLVMEVVSEDDPRRDLVDKRAVYAKAGIPEYWIVDPRDQTICVLVLDKATAEYREAGRYSDAETATSVLLDGFGVSVSDVFDQQAD